jgi:hypothetical protein
LSIMPKSADLQFVVGLNFNPPTTTTTFNG